MVRRTACHVSAASSWIQKKQVLCDAERKGATLFSGGCLFRICVPEGEALQTKNTLRNELNDEGYLSIGPEGAGKVVMG